MDEPLVENTFCIIKAGFQQILNNKLVLTFDDLYNHAYTLVCNHYGGRLYDQVKEVVTHHLQTKVCFPLKLEN